ncbi:MAG: DUF975 family protein [Lachnospiraceae bacterium]|nr:DUF975 family protein [Lachnospiraceae bacterium]
MPRVDLKIRAKNVLATDHWGYVGIVFLTGLLIAAGTGIASLIPFGGILASLFITFPLSVGLIKTLILKRETGNGGLDTVFSAYKENLTNVMLVMFMRELFVFLWSLLFVIPGIYKHYQYYLVPYILAENPNMSYKDALQLSRDLTNGHKFEIFVVELSFIGWGILSCFTLGILAIVYVGPYISLTMVEVYMYLKWKMFGDNDPFRTVGQNPNMNQDVNVENATVEQPVNDQPTVDDNTFEQK